VLYGRVFLFPTYYRLVKGPELHIQTPKDGPVLNRSNGGGGLGEWEVVRTLTGSPLGGVGRLIACHGFPTSFAGRVIRMERLILMEF